MSLTIEWSRRIDHWRKEMPRHFYRALGSVVWQGFVTREQLTPEEASARCFGHMPVGTRWGAKWEYGWFRGRVELPAEAADERVVLCADVGGESAIYVNGLAAGAHDREHTHTTLARRARPGEVFDILVEAYAGHGPRVSTVGPVSPDRDSVPEPPPQQATVGESTFGVWNEDLYQLWIDVETLHAIRSHLDENTLRVSEIDAALRQMTLTIDFETTAEELQIAVVQARADLRPLLACHNGTTAPTLYAFGHSHIDVAWLWPLEETERKAIRTFATQLALMDEYPGYRFLQSQPHLYWMVKKRDPELYARIKRAVARGQWIPEGGMWVEADTNLSGGESLIRQFVYGKRFFQEEFGVDCRMLWLPDVFGYSAAMPQIMRKCGIDYFSTAKIFWAYNGGDPFPYNTFFWEGLDGSEVLVHLCNDYNSQADPGRAIERWNQRVQKDGISSRLMPFGWGDGGGGPTRDHLEYMRRMADLEGVPRTRQASPIAYFEDQAQRVAGLPRTVGELYFQAHRGTLTSQARTKRGNRQCEFALREAEMWVTAAQALTGHRVPREEMAEIWRSVLLHQFHDIIPGSSIHRVYEETEAAHATVLESAARMRRAACQALAGTDEGLTVFNSLPWPRVALVRLPEGVKQLVDADGRNLPVQHDATGRYAEAALPACGWRGYAIGRDEVPEPAMPSMLLARPDRLENELLSVSFDPAGEITSIRDKETGRELAAGICNHLAMYKDVPTMFDAWDVDSMYEQSPVALARAAEVTVGAAGPLVAQIEVHRRLHDSDLRQIISLRRGSRLITFDTEIDWQERHKLLKVEFPVNVHANEALHEIQFGHIARPNHRSRPYDADRFEVANHKWTALVEMDRGAAVLNDCKYGVNVLGRSINLTLLKSALAPDMTADRGRQLVTYGLYAWNGPLIKSDLMRVAYEMNVPVVTSPGKARDRSLFALDATNVIIETIKPAEDGSDDIVVRLYEAARTSTTCTLRSGLPLQAASETDMLEMKPRPLEIVDGALRLHLRPFEIKTLRLTPGKA